MPLGFFEKHLHRRAAGGHDAPASRQQDSTPSNSRKGKLRKARLREGALFPKGVFGFEEYFECFFSIFVLPFKGASSGGITASGGRFEIFLTGSISRSER